MTSLYAPSKTEKVCLLNVTSKRSICLCRHVPDMKMAQQKFRMEPITKLHTSASVVGLTFLKSLKADALPHLTVVDKQMV